MEENKYKIKQILTHKIAKILVFFSVLLVSFGVCSVAHAASLYFSPSSGSYQAGKTFSVNVYVSSAEQAMNAASGVISFPKDKLEVTALSKSGSIFSLWVQEPSFSNTAETINFEGIVLNPGFSGSGGKIITINFKVKSAGEAALNFSSGSILANDGQGTNILGGMGSANFVLSGAAPAPVEPSAPAAEKPAAATGIPAAPSISSSTHPDSNKWYSNKNPLFSWNLSKDITGISMYLSQSATSNPGLASDGLSAVKSYVNVEDGTWYFHIRFRNAKGWGPITHFKFQVDTKAPENFDIKFVGGAETENPQPIATFNAADSLSGIDYYKVKIGDNDFVSVPAETLKNNQYALPLQDLGKHTILVQAFDKAGNHTAATAEFTIKPLKAPVFTQYPKNLVSDQVLNVEGITDYPNAQVTVWLQKDKDDAQTFVVQSDKDGKFTFVSDKKLNEGTYKLWAYVTDARNAKSGPSEKITVSITSSQIVAIGSRAISILAVVVPLLALILILLFILWHSWHKFKQFRKKIKKLKKDVRETESSLHKAFDMLKEDIADHIKLLEKTKNKRELTEEEEKIVKQLKRDLDNAEKILGKEIKEIKDEIDE